MDNYTNEENTTSAKTKVRFAEIIVHVSSKKPFFEICYGTFDGENHIGFGSYYLENVFKWLNECLEIEGKHPGDFALVKHGRWKSGGDAKTRTCSRCGHSFKYDGFEWIWCPICGAKMDGDSNV